MQKSSLKSILGIIVHQGGKDVYEALKPIGFNYCRITAEHFLVEQEKGEFKWDWLDRAVNEWMEMTGFPPFLSIYGVPYWHDTSKPLVGGINGKAIGHFNKDYVPYWEEYVHQLLDRYPFIPDIGITVETNIKNWMQQSMDEFFEYILIPAAQVIHSKGKRVIGPCPTVQWYESVGERDRARIHMQKIMQYGKGFIDKHDFHSYGTSGKSVTRQNELFMFDALGKRFPMPAEFWCSETGFSTNRTGVPAAYQGDPMLHKLQNFIPWLWIYGGFFERVFLYHATDGANNRRRNGILNPDLSFTDVAKYLQQELEKVEFLN